MKKIIALTLCLLVLANPVFAESDDSFFSSIFTKFKQAFSKNSDQEIKDLQVRIKNLNKKVEDDVKSDVNAEFKNVADLKREYVKISIKLENYTVYLNQRMNQGNSDLLDEFEKIKSLKEELDNLGYMIELKENAAVLRSFVQSNNYYADPSIELLQSDLNDLEKKYYAYRLRNLERRISFLEKNFNENKISTVFYSDLKRIKTSMNQSVLLYDNGEYDLLENVLDELEDQVYDLGKQKTPDKEKTILQLSVLNKKSEGSDVNTFIALKKIKEEFDS